MRRMRRAILLLSVVALVAAACGGSQTTTQSPAPATQAAAATQAPVQTATPAPTPAYPTRAIDLFTAFSPGGTSDLVARMTGQYLSKKWNVPVNVGNKPGGNTVPANVELYNAAPDGYTLMMDTIGSSSILPNSVPNLPFNVLDRSFVAMISSNSMLLFVGANSPFKTLKDVADEAKKDPASFTWTGVGVAEIPVRQFFKSIGVDVAKTKPVVSGGSVPATVLAANGSVKLALAAVGPSLAQVSSGIIRPLAIAADKRWASLPNVPTTAEAGYPTMKVVSWIGVTGPPKLPEHVLAKWNDAVKEMVKDPAILEEIRKFASVADYRDPKAFKEEVANEIKEIEALWK